MTQRSATVIAHAHDVGDVAGSLEGCPGRRRTTRSAVSRSPFAQDANPMSAVPAPRPTRSVVVARARVLDERGRWSSSLSPSSQREPGAVDRRSSVGSHASSCSLTATIPSAAGVVGPADRRPPSARHPASRASTPAGLGSGKPRSGVRRRTAPAASGPRSSGSASSHRRSSGLLPVPSHRRRGPARPGPPPARRRPPAIAWRIASARLAVAGVPAAGPPVQVRHRVGLLVEQPGLQHVGEEVVVAVPAAAGRRAGPGRGCARSSAASIARPPRGR